MRGALPLHYLPCQKPMCLEQNRTVLRIPNGGRLAELHDNSNSWKTLLALQDPQKAICGPKGGAKSYGWG